jgi:hypothetical protein
MHFIGHDPPTRVNHNRPKDLTAISFAKLGTGSFQRLEALP